MGRAAKNGKHLRDLVEALAASSERREVFTQTCELLDDVIGLNSAVLIPCGPGSAFDVGERALTLNHAMAETGLYVQHYAHCDPLRPWLADPAHFNTAVRNTDMVDSVRMLKNSEFATDFLARVPALYVVGAVLEHCGVPLAGFAIHRPKHDPDFTDRDKLVLTRVMPILARTLYTLDVQEGVRVGLPIEIEGKLRTLDLTPREEEIVRLVLEGLMYREIAGRLHIGLQRVKDHMTAILGKAHARRRSDLVAWLVGLRWTKGA